MFYHDLFLQVCTDINFFFKFSDPIGHTKIARDVIQKTGTKMICVWFTSLTPTFNLVHCDTVKLMLKSSKPKPTQGLGSPYRFIMHWIGNQILNEVKGTITIRRTSYPQHVGKFFNFRTFIEFFNHEGKKTLKFWVSGPDFYSKYQ